MSFNSREYEWADITVIAGGRDLTGIRGIKISEKAEREPLYGKGRNPVSLQTGNFTYDGEMMVTQSEYLALTKAGKGSLLNLAIDVVVGFGNPLELNTPTYKIAQGVRFTEASVDFKQGDKFTEVALPFLCLNWKDKQL
jgi:hypothetical protein